MRLKTNLVISVLFVVLLGFVYFYEIKGGEERRSEAEKSKKLLDFSDHEARRLTIERGDTTIVLEKTQDTWKLTAPVATDAEDDAVDRYLRNLNESEVERVVEDSGDVASDATLLERYGLDAPRLSVFLELVEETKDTVRFGSDSPTERFAYAQRSGRDPSVFTVRAWRFDNLAKGVFDLRDKRVLPFDRQEVREIRLVRPAEEDPIVITRNEGEAGWRLMSPVASPANQQEVDELLQKLEDGEAMEFASESPTSAELSGFGLVDGTRSTVSLLIGSDRAEKQFQIGSEGGEEGGSYARDASRPQVFVVDSTLVGETRKSLFTLRDKQICQIDDRELVANLILERDGENLFEAERDSTNSWMITSPERRKAKSWKLNGMLTDLDGLQTTEFVADAAETSQLDLAQYGLDQPSLRILFHEGDGAGSVDIRFVHVAGASAYVYRLGVPTIYKVSAEALENLELQFDDVAQAAATAELLPADGTSTDAVVTSTE